MIIFIKKKISTLFCFAVLFFNFFYCSYLFSQGTLPLNAMQNDYLECEILKLQSNFHSSIKPYRSEQINAAIDSSKNITEKYLSGKYFTKDNSFFVRPLIHINYNKFNINLSPQFVLGGLFQVDSNEVYVNSGIGARVNGNYSQKFYFDFVNISSNSSFNTYTDSIIVSNKIIPSEGIAHSTTLGHSYSSNRIILSFSPNKTFNFQIGKDKTFFGDGYRSLLLSENSSAYPFAKISTTIWKIQYVNMFAKFSEPINNGDIEKKYGTFHYLSWNTTKWLNFSFFESVVWQHKDSTGTRGFDYNYLNPVIFYRPVEFSLGSPDNSLMGLNVSIKPLKKIKLYSQIMLDEFSLEHIKAKDGWWANKQAVQAGVLWTDVVGINGLSARGEVNWVRPFTYSHYTFMQNYGNMHQPLAHPLGANFEEVLAIIKYVKNRWLVTAYSSFARYGDDYANFNFGRNIYLSYATHTKEFDNRMLQGSLNEVFNNVIKLNYLVNPSWNLFVETGICYRTNLLNNNKNNNLYAFFSIKTILHSLNPDFLN